MTHIFADIWVPGIPRPGGSKRAFVNPKTGRAIITDAAGQNTKDWKATVKTFAFNNYHGDPIDMPLRVVFYFVFPRPKSHYRTGKFSGELRADAPLFKETQPDVLKLIRPAEDACTGILWVDDARIVQEPGFKVWGIQPGLRMIVSKPLWLPFNMEDGQSDCVRNL